MRIFMGIFLLLVLLAPAASGQPESGAVITITSRPSGCTVYLSGEIELVTTTPATIRESLAGPYRVSAVRSGFETWSSTVIFTPGTGRRLEIDLIRKTRFKAAVRSVFFPGWGQYYAREKTRSVLWGLGVLSSGAVALTYEARYRDRKDDWEMAKKKFAGPGSLGEKERLREEVLSLHQRAYDAESDRRLAWGITIGAWALNVLDAWIFFPEDNRFANIPISIQPSFDSDATRAVLTFTF